MAGFIMPSLGAAGDAVAQGDIIAEVETDKSIIEVEVFESGVVRALLVKEGETVPVGTVLAEIAHTAADAATAAAPVKSSQAPTTGLRAAPGALISAGASGLPLDGPMVSPATRRKAHELAVSLERVRGGGERGRITQGDVEEAAAPSERPWVVDGQVVARPLMRVTLGADHRVRNAHQGARFLRALERIL